MLGVIAEIELVANRGLRERFADVFIGEERSEEIAALIPHLHRIALHDLIGVLTRHAGGGEREQNALGMNKAAEPVEIGAHAIGIHDESS